MLFASLIRMNTMRLRFDIAYDGTDFHGWARQKGDLRTVQGTVEDALELVLRHPVSLTVAGRTDAGVHARGQVAHADIDPESLQQRSLDGDPARLVRRLAKLLPEDIRVHAVREVSPDFDARFSALARHYIYRVTTNPAGALPTRTRDTAVWARSVDVDLMQQTADVLLGLHDFAAFCKPRPHATTIRDVHSFRWVDASTDAEPQLYEAHISADAFCWNMVRALTATCLMVGQGKRDLAWATGLLDATERRADVPLAPAKGLTFDHVVYPPEQGWAARAATTRDRRSL